MPFQPTLFDEPLALPTTRAVAMLVKQGGPAALTDARLRADQVRYQEVACRSALNRVEGMPFKWTLNPYRGCTHGCHYCFARRYQTQLELDVGDAFSTVILVKVNFADVLRRELDKPSWVRERVALGTATDPYQPIEGAYKITRRCLEALLASRTPVGVVTKGPLVVRDRDLLVELGRVTSLTVCVSVPTVDEAVWTALEPGTTPPLQRLRAVRELVDAGVDAGVLIAPVVPGFTDTPGRLDATMRAIADHGAAFVGAQPLHLEGGTRDHFLDFVAREFPTQLGQLERLYIRKHAPPAYRSRIAALVGGLKRRHGLGDRP